MAQVFVFGSNREGQAGIAHHEDIVVNPVELTNCSIDVHRVSRIAVTQKQTYICESDGSVSSCGENDNFELGRSGKRSLLAHIDSLEAFQFADIAAGEQFALLACRDGRVVSWGRNEMGQLGLGNRENREKPRVSNIIPEGVLQISAGAQHVICLSKSGDVYTWGANRKGQLGDGQLTSSFIPRVVQPLKHRPVVSIACGEAHCMVMTVGGNVYAWGDNSCGQLGVGDTVHRLRPEFLRSIRAARARRISCGRQHSAVLTPGGLLFTFGSDSVGQCGHGQHPSQNLLNRFVTTPTAVERLREMKVIEVACGGHHTLALCEVSAGQNRVYGMGLNTSGQLGMGHTSNIYVPVVVNFPLHEGYTIVGVASGCLAMHSFAYTSGIPVVRPALCAVQLSNIIAVTQRFSPPVASSQGSGTSNETNGLVRPQSAIDAAGFENTVALRQLREYIDTAFSSISVLNASFRNKSAGGTDAARTSGGNLSIQLDMVRLCYTIIFNTNNQAILATLGRATLTLSSKLIECPFDDPENLSVFLIVLENPLLLDPQKFYVAVERVISGILALPRMYRNILFGWLKDYPSEYFCRVLQVFEQYLCFALSRDGKTKDLDVAPVVLVLESLHDCNKVAEIVPESYFYCDQLLQEIDLRAEWNKYLAAVAERNDKVFNFCRFPFLLNVSAKLQLLQEEFRKQKQLQVYAFKARYLSQPDPGDGRVRIPPYIAPIEHRGLVQTPVGPVGVAEYSLCLEIVVRRHAILEDVMTQLRVIYAGDREALFLPMRVRFEGEDAVDEGGVSRELMTLAVSELLRTNTFLSRCGHSASSRTLWFSGPSRPPPDTNSSASASPREDVSDEFFLGVLVGLACYNNLYIDVPLPPAIYKIMTGEELTLSDLWRVDADLARGLQNLLDFPLEEGLISDVFGVTFSASANPLIDNAQHIQYEEVSSPKGELGGSIQSKKRGRSMDLSRQDSFDSVQDSVAVAVTTEPSSRPKVEYVELKPGGANIVVERGNRAEFVQLFVRYALYLCKKREVDSFLSGLKEFLHGTVLKMCSHTEIDEMLSGSRKIGSLLELRKNATYRGKFNDHHPVIEWFWEVVAGLSVRYRKKFLHFLSGSDRVPVGGLEQFRIVIQSTAQSSASLPVAHTCFNILDMPETYESREQLQQRLLLALDNYTGFALA